MKNETRIVSRTAVLNACITALSFTFCASAFAKQAVVIKQDSNLETGQAFLTHHAGRCYALMPTHVATEQLGRLDIRLEGAPALLGSTTASVDLGDDAAIAPVTGITISECGIAASSVAQAVDTHVRKAGLATLRTVNGDGTIANMPVALIDNDGSLLLRIQPTHDKHQIRKGLSGSELIMHEHMIGMLLSVNPRSGVGTVLRQDALMGKVNKYLNDAARLSVAEVAPAGRLTVESWSSLPSPPDSRATNLTLPEFEAGVWRSVPERWPTSVDFSRADGSSVWSGIALDAREIPVDERPSRAEILLQLGNQSSTWRSLISVRLNYVDDVALVPFAPSRGGTLRLRLWGPEGKEAQAGLAVSLKRVLLLDR